MKSKLFMILVVLVMLVTVVGLGCLGGDDKNATNNTTPENSTPETPENSTPETPENSTPEQPPVSSGGSVTVVQGEGGPNPGYFVRTNDRRFVTTSLSISSGETIRFMNMETISGFRHQFHSEEGAFEDFNLDPRYSATLTFSQPGTYRIQLLNAHTGEPYGDTAPVLTVTVT